MHDRHLLAPCVRFFSVIFPTLPTWRSRPALPPLCARAAPAWRAASHARVAGQAEGMTSSGRGAPHICAGRDNKRAAGPLRRRGGRPHARETTPLPRRALRAPPPPALCPSPSRLPLSATPAPGPHIPPQSRARGAFSPAPRHLTHTREPGGSSDAPHPPPTTGGAPCSRASARALPPPPPRCPAAHGAWAPQRRRPRPPDPPPAISAKPSRNAPPRPLS